MFHPGRIWFSWSLIPTYPAHQEQGLVDCDPAIRSGHIVEWEVVQGQEKLLMPENWYPQHRPLPPILPLAHASRRFL